MSRKANNGSRQNWTIFLGVVVAGVIITAGLYAAGVDFAFSIYGDEDAEEGELSFKIEYINGTAYTGNVTVFTCDADADLSDAAGWDELEADLTVYEWGNWSVNSDGTLFYIVAVYDYDDDYDFYDAVSGVNTTFRLIPVAEDLDVTGYEIGSRQVLVFGVTEEDYGEKGYPVIVTPGDSDADLNTSALWVTVNVTFTADVAEWSEVNGRYICDAMMDGTATYSSSVQTVFGFVSEDKATVLLPSDFVSTATLTFGNLSVDGCEIFYGDTLIGAWDF